MKAVTPALIFLAALLAGCSDSSQPARQSGAAEAASAPTDYLKSVTDSQKKAVRTIDLAAINKAIESFYVQEGRFPKSLEELEEKAFVRVIPLPPPGKKLNYDTNNGVVTLEADLGKE